MLKILIIQGYTNEKLREQILDPNKHMYQNVKSFKMPIRKAMNSEEYAKKSTINQVLNKNMCCWTFGAFKLTFKSCK